MKHPLRLERYPGTLDELASELGDMRYDAVAEFLALLAEKLGSDSAADSSRGRSVLAGRLSTASRLTREASEEIGRAWGICEPKMRE